MDVSANVYDLFTETSRFGHNLAVSLKKKGSAHNEKNDLPWIVGRGRCSPDDSRGLVHDMVTTLPRNTVLNWLLIVSSVRFHNL